MAWEQVLIALGAIGAPGTIILGVIVYRQGRKADEVLDVAANVKSTFDAQAEINEERRLDVIRLREAHRECEDATNDLRRALAEAHLRKDEQAREIAHLKAVVNEHEQTIARHERTINQLRAGTQADRRGEGVDNSP